MPPLFRRALSCALFGLGIAGCASSGSRSPSASNNAAVPARRNDRSIIAADEIAASHETNLYDLVRLIRVEWLTGRGAAASAPGTMSGTSGTGRSRGSTSTTSTTGFASTPLQVYMNRQKVGTIDVLRDISPVGVASLKYYSPTEAQAMFGTDNASGAIQVIPVSGGAQPE